MKKVLFLLAAVICLLMPSPQPVTAQDIDFIAVNHRIYEDGRDVTKVIVQLLGITKEDINEIRFYEPGSPDVPSPLVTKDTADVSCENAIFSNYTFGGSFNFWIWDPVITAVEEDNWNYAYYLTWSLYNYTPDPGTYRIEVVVNGNVPSIYIQAYEFPGSYHLPIVSLVSDKEKIRKKGGGKLDLEELSDGSLVLRWHAPAVAATDIDSPALNTSARVLVYLETDPDVGECDRLISFRSPTHMGMFIMPPNAVEALKSCNYYNGYFDFQVQIRVNDNSERSYSNFQRYYPE